MGILGTILELCHQGWQGEPSPQLQSESCFAYANHDGPFPGICLKLACDSGVGNKTQSESARELLRNVPPSQDEITTIPALWVFQSR